jgi:alkyl hydroperoxide reductase subunit D
MNIAELKTQLPPYAKDLRLNLDSVLSEDGSPGLSGQQIALVALASATASRHTPLTKAVSAFAAEHCEEDELNGARAAAAIMGMNNVYYRFTHLVDDSEYSNMRASLRMNVMRRPGVSKTDFEMASLAVSAINGCGACMNSHEKTLRQAGLGAQAVQSAVRIAAVIHAVAVTLEQMNATAEQTVTA